MGLPLICIDGTKVRDGQRNYTRYLTFIAGKRVPLSGVPFKLLAMLALACMSKVDDGWVHTGQLYRPAGLAGRYLYLMKQQIRRRLRNVKSLRNWQIIENDRQGYYRLIARPERIRFINPQALQEFGDMEILAMIEKHKSPKIIR